MNWITRHSLPAVFLALLSVSCAASSDREVRGEMNWDGETRSYRLVVPASDPAQPMPLVVALHGGLGSGRIFARQSHFDAVAAEHGFLVVYPDGIGRTWNAGSCCGPARDRNVDDVGFIAQLVKKLGREFAIDPDRVYATGFSNGAMLLSRIVCERPGLFAAVAPVSGGLMRSECSPGGPVSALLIQGMLDEHIPWQGGEYDGSYRRSMDEMVAIYRTMNGCETARRTDESDADIQCQSLSQCPDGRAVRWCGAPQVGHQWPGGKSYFVRSLGPNSTTVDASSRIGEFFAGLSTR